MNWYVIEQREFWDEVLAIEEEIANDLSNQPNGEAKEERATLREAHAAA
jgi:hypothetical protein